MLKLLDVLKISEAELKNYKVHFAIGVTDRMKPYKKFIIGEFKEWQEQQTNKNFSRPYILSLIYYEKGWKYGTELVDCQTDLIGRIVVSYKKEYRQSYPNLEMDPKSGIPPREMCVSSILDKRVSITDFPGFGEVISIMRHC